MSSFIIAGSVFALTFVILMVVLSKRGGEVEQKQNLIRRMAAPENEGDISITRKNIRGGDSGLSFLYKIDLMRTLEESMWQAGLYMRVSEMLLIIMLMFGGGLFFGQAMWHDFTFALLPAVGFGLMPIFFIRWRRGRRLRAFIQQLPAALDLVKSSLEAGHSFNRGLQVVVQEFTDPLGSEFRTVLEQTRIGLPLPRALDDLLKRVPEEDLRLLVVAVKVQTQVGSSLASIIGRLAEIVRTRQRLRLQIKALTAQSRMGGYIVGALPAIVLGIFSLVQPSYAATLFTDPTGLKILKFAIVLDLLAFATIRKLLQVKY
ncbi:MAG TPA: type II secretion system F family protein [Candidatus Binataceae bacterium]|nr:type II secretion system F family protein [Candidatus Binataceae bacterium]